MPTQILFITCLFVSVYVHSSLLTSYAADVIAAPIYHEGDQWEFRVNSKGAPGTTDTSRLGGNYLMTYTNGQFMAVEVVNGITANLSDDGKQRLMELTGVAQDGRQLLKFPMAVGNKWSGSYSYRVRRGSSSFSLRENNSYEVKEHVKLSTPAGEFDSFKIEADGITSGARDVPLRRVYYYSHQAKINVKSRIDVDTGSSAELELIRFVSPK